MKPFSLEVECFPPRSMTFFTLDGGPLVESMWSKVITKSNTVFCVPQSLHHNVCVCSSVHLKVHRNVLKEKYHHETAFSEMETFFKGIITEEFAKNILLLLFCSGWKKELLSASQLLQFFVYHTRVLVLLNTK